MEKVKEGISMIINESKILVVDDEPRIVEAVKAYLENSNYKVFTAFDGYECTIDSHVKNLRSKIEKDSSNPKYILTVRGIGYKFGCVE